MAFMMPIIKNDWELYQTNRSAMVSRRNSVSGTSSAMVRSRKISESAKSEILSSSKTGRSNFMNKPTRSVPTNMTQLRQMPRPISRSSQMNMYRSGGAVDVSKNRCNSLIRKPTCSMMTQTSPQSSVSSSPTQSPSPSPSPSSDNKATKKLHKKLLDKIKKTLGIKPSEK